MQQILLNIINLILIISSSFRLKHLKVSYSKLQYLSCRFRVIDGSNGASGISDGVIDGLSNGR